MKSRATNITFCIAILLLVTFPDSFTSQDNPIPIDSGSGTIPIPQETTSGIYLKGEKIVVIFDEEKAHVDAKYIFKNNKSNITDLKVILPFKSMPENITLLVEGKEENYEWVNDFEINDLDFEFRIPDEVNCQPVNGLALYRVDQAPNC